MNHNDLELPMGKRTRFYRLFEILPAFLSYGMLILFIILSLINPLWASIYLLVLVMSVIVRSVGIAYRTLTGHHQLEKAQKVDWRQRLEQLEDPVASYAAIQQQPLPKRHQREFHAQEHRENLRLMAADPASFPRPSQLYQAVIVAAYNESYDVLQPTIESVKNTTYNNKQIILVLAYEERGGVDIARTAARLQQEYGDVFFTFQTIMHPKDMPNEVIGKGGNITYAGKQLQRYCDEQGIAYSDVMITTLDSDNRPYPSYFDYVAYEYIVHPERKRLSYQPIALYFGNIWDAPAPMRVIATGNSFWTIISSMRPHTLRNFASHSQPMDALVEMNFWSTRSIVEDGHQYWRSYFYFAGDYSVLPIHVPIYQDAVMDNTFWGTVVAQFKQLRRWSYGASDIPYVAIRTFTRRRNVPFAEVFARFMRLLDGHVTLAVMAFLVTFGGWVPLLINQESSRSYAVHMLPEVISNLQRFAMVGIFITVFLMLKMLPPRPERYKRRRSFAMVAQWILMPVTSICFSAIGAFNAQTHLAFGRYLDKFDVTVKATTGSRDRAKAAKQAQKAAKKQRKKE
ncbi:glycosyltransferase family 2 protein [Candidatus Saccharibacteria bacterium]|nr:glycosyltransferase family 2 protein [Candidatus Saccharibacteria bacterium]